MRPDFDRLAREILSVIVLAWRPDFNRFVTVILFLIVFWGRLRTAITHGDRLGAFSIVILSRLWGGLQKKTDQTQTDQRQQFISCSIAKFHKYETDRGAIFC